MSMKDLALREAALKSLADAIAGELKAVKSEMQAALEDSGASQVPAVLPDGTKVATISRPSTALAARVTDEELLKKWVSKTAPEGSITSRVVREINPAYLKALLADLTAAGVPQWCDKETGELHDVPGVAIQPARSTTHSVRLAKDGADAIIAAWRAGELAHFGLFEIAGGTE